jgi:hypothetical protein
MHYYALNPKMLELVTNYFEDNAKEYLLGCLMKNKFGFSALELSVINNSVACTEIFLKKLCLFKDL